MKLFYVFFFVVALSICGCSAKSLGVGQVAHQVITCTSDIDCKTKLANDCPKGGVLHDLRQAVEIEYSCNQ